MMMSNEAAGKRSRHAPVDLECSRQWMRRPPPLRSLMSRLVVMGLPR